MEVKKHKVNEQSMTKITHNIFTELLKSNIFQNAAFLPLKSAFQKSSSSFLGFNVIGFNLAWLFALVPLLYRLGGN